MSKIPFYKARKIMRSEEVSSFRIVDLWTFRSSKSNKRYIVEIEYISDNFFGIKFFWKGVANSENRYTFLTNDNEPRTIIMSCIMIMLDYFKQYPFASFGFVAAQNYEIEKERKNKNFCEHPVNKRFRFYRRMMLSLFSPDNFCQYSDKNNSIYLLINKKALLNGYITVDRIENEITSLYEGEYSITPENL